MTPKLLFFVVTVVLCVGGCKFTVPVDAEGQPTGAPAMIQPSETGSMEAVTVDPEGTETPIELTGAPDPDALIGAVGVGAKLLPPPWNLLIPLGLGGLTMLRNRKR